MSPQTAGPSAACGTTRSTRRARSCRYFHIINQLVKFYHRRILSVNKCWGGRPPNRAELGPVLKEELDAAETAAAGVSTVLTAAETGHLVLSTLHTNDAIQAVARILDSF